MRAPNDVAWAMFFVDSGILLELSCRRDDRLPAAKLEAKTRPANCGNLPRCRVAVSLAATSASSSDRQAALKTIARPLPHLETHRPKSRTANRPTMKHHTQEFLKYVRLVQTRGVPRGQAWEIAVGVMPRVHEQVVLENSLPAGAQLSPDGKVIVADWPVTPDTLRKLGLPMDASKQEYETYHRAEAVKVTPDIAALLVRELIQFSQITHATTFKEALAFLQKHRPELHKLAIQPQ